jgi:hypothetical protein
LRLLSLATKALVLFPAELSTLFAACELCSEEIDKLRGAISSAAAQGRGIPQTSHQQDKAQEMRRPVEQLEELLPRTEFHVLPPKILIPPEQPINSLTNSRKEQRTAGSLERDRRSSDQNVIVFPCIL